MITLRITEFGTLPRVAAVIDTSVPIEDLCGLARKGVDIFEVRADLIDQPVPCIAEYVREVREAVSVPLIGTVRENERTKGRRLEYFGAIMPLVDCVDIELGAPDAADIAGVAQGKVVLVSEHDFEKTPDEAGLDDIVTRAVRQGARIVKLTTFAKTEADGWRLLEFAKRSAVPMVAFAMGEAGTFSRLKACDYGSLFTYGYITAAVAPGQVSVEELLRSLKPAGR